MLKLLKDALQYYEEARDSVLKSNVKNKPINNAQAAKRPNDS